MAPASKVAQGAALHGVSPRLVDFFAAVRDTNPFAANRITEPSPYDVDVPAIHAASFDRLVALGGQALRDRSGIGAVLLGGAGIGRYRSGTPGLDRLYDVEAPVEASAVAFMKFFALPPALISKSRVSLPTLTSIP